MPIYEYRCKDCGHQEEFLQKVGEPALSQCPACGKASFYKLLSAAGFQLKGSGWYATDFRNSGAKPADKKPEGANEAGGGSQADAKTEAKSEKKTEAAPAAP
jgi:putative FmdB family regulatory protein